MHRAIATLITAALVAGCAHDTPLPRLSIKDPVPQPQRQPAEPNRADISIAPAVVIGGSEADNKRLSLALSNALTEAGYDVRAGGPWRVVGLIKAGVVTWTIVGPDGLARGVVSQSKASTPALDAVVPGVLSHLPRPSTPI